MLQRNAERVLKKHNIGRPEELMAAGMFFGATRLQLRSGDFTVSAVSHAIARSVPKHAHAHAFFSMLISGHYREWFAEGHWDARPLSMVLRPAQAEHHDEIGPDGAVFLCVDIAPSYWDALADSGERLQRRALEDRPMSLVALRLLKELCEKRAGWHGVAESLINELVAEYVAESHHVGRRSAPAWLERAIEMLHGAPAHQSLRAIAAELDLHPVHVSRAFKQHKGMSVSEYLRELRLQSAARGLLESHEPLAAIAQENGFSDQSHMTRELMRATNWSPAKLRCECGRLR